MGYTLEQYMRLAKLHGFDETSGGFMSMPSEIAAFGDAVARGDPAPFGVDIHKLMKLTEAYRSDHLGNGPAARGYWRSVLDGLPTKGVQVSRSISGAAAFSIDVTDVLRAGVHYGFIVDGSSLTVHSRQALDPSNHPVLMVGEKAVPCEADVSIMFTTSQSIGDRATLTAAGSSLIYMRFAEVVLGEGERAILWLHPTKALTQQMVTVAQLIPPIDFTPAFVRDIYEDADVYFRSATLGGGTDAYEKCLRHQLTTPVEWNRAEWIDDHMRGYWDRGRRAVSYRIPLFHPVTGAEARMVQVQVEMRIAPNFSSVCREAGKWLGFGASGSDLDVRARQAPWPGEPEGRRGEPYGGNGAGPGGWSARGGYYPSITPSTHPAYPATPLHSYMYYLWRERNGQKYLWHEAVLRYAESIGLHPHANYNLDQAAMRALCGPGEALEEGVSKTGNVIRWSNYPPLLWPGEWQRINRVMRINTPDVADGWIQSAIDGNLCEDTRHICWRGARNMPPKLRKPNSPSCGIGTVWCNMYHGGTLFPTATTWIDMRKLVVKVLEWDE